MNKSLARWPLALGFGVLLCTPTWADNKAIAVDEMGTYLDFMEYGGATIFAEQIPKDEYAKAQIPGATPTH